MINLLLVEDEEEEYELTLLELKRRGLVFQSKRVDSIKELLNELNNNSFDVVISDNNLVDLNASSVLDQVRVVDKTIPFIIFSGDISESEAFELMKRGANDYVLKTHIGRLLPVIKRELEKLNRDRAIEEKLRLAENKYEMLINSISDIIFSIDTDLNVIFWNHVAERTTSISKDEILGKNVKILFKRLKITKALNSLFQSIHLKEKISDSYFSVVKGVKRHFEYTVHPSENVCTVIIKDKTNEAKAQRDLKYATKEFEDFVYKLAHDIKGPVATIMGLVHISMAEIKDPKQQEYNAMLLKSSSRLNSVISILQEVVELRKRTPIKESVKLGSIGNYISSSSKRQLAEIDVDTKYIGADDNDIIHTDFELLANCLDQLIENSIKYKKRDSILTLFITIELNEYMCAISVKDNGIGIDRANIARVCEMFYRANLVSDGFGLGLFRAKSIVNTLEGNILINSTLNESTEVTIRLPLANKKI